MKISIRPIQHLNSTGTQFSILYYTALMGGGGADAAWELLDESDHVIGNGRAFLTGPEYVEWGSDDRYAINLMAKKVGFEPLVAYTPPAPAAPGDHIMQPQRAVITAPVRGPTFFGRLAKVFKPNKR